MDARIRRLNQEEPNLQGRYVLYECGHNRRAAGNHALLFAAGVANRMEVPLLVYESLSCDYPYASDRLHTFLLEGVPGTAANLHKLGAGYVFELQRRKGEKGRAHELEAGAAAVVVDDHPLDKEKPRSYAVCAYAVDASCVVPAHCIEKQMYAAYALRPRIRRLLPQFLKPVPAVTLARRLRGPVPPMHTEVTARNAGGLSATCEIDHTVSPSTAFRGGRKQAEARLETFLKCGLSRYARDKNEPSAHATSNLSPYLRAGFLSALEIALAVGEYAREHKVMAEEFLEELIVRRELAYNFAWYAGRIDSLDALPEWARETIRRHRKDKRNPCYTREQFEGAETYDNLWNATQKELLLRGTIHGYYRMYWGKKIVEWSESAGEALATMLYLNDKYALDGQDPNSYGNILWCFGLHDRPWPERPVFGTIRCMVRSGMERKTNVNAYMQEIRYLEQTGKELVT
jgi:deoxyribodipyrimidine photo-lyase